MINERGHVILKLTYWVLNLIYYFLIVLGISW
nr:MAG TPA: hypothetical protein [Caudoviricetes sp.]